MAVRVGRVRPRTRRPVALTAAVSRPRAGNPSLAGGAKLDKAVGKAATLPSLVAGSRLVQPVQRDAAAY